MTGAGTLAVRPWVAPVLEAGAAARAARLGRRHPAAEAAGWSARLVHEGEPPDPCETFDLSLGGHPARLSLPSGLVEVLLGTLDPAAPAAEGQARRLLLELAAEPVLDALDPVLPAGRMEAGDALPTRAHLALRHADQDWAAMLDLSDGAADALAAALDRLPPLAQAPDLPVVLHLRLAACALGRRELRSLRPGDVVLPDFTCLLVAGGRCVWQVRVETGPTGETATVTSTRRRAAELGMESWIMSDGSPQPLEDASLDDVPVHLVFESGRIEVSLGELGQIGPGHVFGLPGRAGLVDILANGRRIGQGEVVQVGDGAGVRVLSLNGAADPTP